MTTKYCPRCATEKAAECFGRNPARKDGMQTYCVECTRAYARDQEKKAGGRKQRGQAQAAKKAALAEQRARGVKTCGECLAEKPLEEFVADKSRGDGLCRVCKICDKARLYARREANPGIRKEESRRYYAEHKEQAVANREKFFAENPEYRADWARRRYQADPEAGRARAAAWREANPEKAAEINRRSALKNAESRRQQARAYQMANPAKRAALQALRKAQQRKATPAWANLFFLEEAYSLAELRTRMLGFPWHVDHIVPMQSKLVCGLHTDRNVRVIPANDNIRKGNRRWPDMP